MLKRTIELPAARAEVEAHDAFLFVVESGTIRDLDELREYQRQLERIIAQTGQRRAVVDARAETGEAGTEIREAMWQWLVDPAVGFERVAFVLPSEMAVARVNMTALARSADVRAFDSVFEAQRWVVSARKRRSTSGATTQPLPAARPASSNPPPAVTPPRVRVDGTYRVTEGREETVRTSTRPPRSAPAAAPVPLTPPPPRTSEVHRKVGSPAAHERDEDEGRGGGSHGLA